MQSRGSEMFSDNLYLTQSSNTPVKSRWEPIIVILVPPDSGPNGPLSLFGIISVICTTGSRRQEMIHFPYSIIVKRSKELKLITMANKKEGRIPISPILALESKQSRSFAAGPYTLGPTEHCEERQGMP